MKTLLLGWLLNAVSLYLVSRLLSGFQIRSFVIALIAALVVAVVNATVGLVFRVVAFPLTVVTLGLFLIVINALMLKLAAALVDGFTIRGFLPAVIGSVILSLLHMVLRALFLPGD